MFSVSIGVMAYNEEANVGLLLDALLRQRLSSCYIKEIIVVVSGCTDNTEEIVKTYARQHPKIKLLVQERREGKASATNLFLSKAKGDIVVLESCDTLPEDDTVENLVKPFSDPKVGMTGGHPVPINANGAFMGFTDNLFWSLHHKLALKRPKLGELVTLRNRIIKRIPKDTAVDEASFEALITEAGYKIYYAADAIVHNKGPETVGDFLKQRRRITAGHLHLQKTRNYTVSTMNGFRILGLLLGSMKWSPKSVLWTAGAVSLELYGRLLGHFDFHIRKKNPFVWDIATSTKNLDNDRDNSQNTSLSVVQTVRHS